MKSKCSDRDLEWAGGAIAFSLTARAIELELVEFDST